MNKPSDIANRIFSIKSEQEFNEISLEVFRYQAVNNEVYSKYINYLNIDFNTIRELQDIPFLPIEFFKTQKVISGNIPVETIFSSSGTTGIITSKHYIANLEIYEKSFLKSFRQFYGNIEEYVVLGLLPSYLERKGSSLVYMVDKLIQLSKRKESGFYLHDYEKLAETLKTLNTTNTKALLIGVSYALLDMIEKEQFHLANTTIMETGGMKGRRKEMIKEELHSELIKGFGVESIHSEYGMTELLSQAYSKGNGIFNTPNWMKIIIRDPYDPFEILNHEKSGGINVIDLANIHSCSFIETKDLGKILDDGSFEVLGRFDNSDIRGCNLMIN